MPHRTGGLHDMLPLLPPIAPSAGPIWPFGKTSTRGSPLMPQRLVLESGWVQGSGFRVQGSGKGEKHPHFHTVTAFLTYHRFPLFHTPSIPPFSHTIDSPFFTYLDSPFFTYHRFPPSSHTIDATVSIPHSHVVAAIQHRVVYHRCPCPPAPVQVFMTSPEDFVECMRLGVPSVGVRAGVRPQG